MLGESRRDLRYEKGMPSHTGPSPSQSQDPHRQPAQESARRASSTLDKGHVALSPSKSLNSSHEEVQPPRCPRHTISAPNERENTPLNVTRDPRKSRPAHRMTMSTKLTNSPTVEGELPQNKFIRWVQQLITSGIINHYLSSAQDTLAECLKDETDLKNKHPDHKALHEQVTQVSQRVDKKVKTLSQKLFNSHSLQSELQQSIDSSALIDLFPFLGPKKVTDAESQAYDRVSKRLDQLEAENEALKERVSQLTTSTTQHLANSVEPADFADLKGKVSEQKLAIAKCSDCFSSKEDFRVLEKQLTSSLTRVDNLASKLNQRNKDLDRYISIYESFVDKTTEKSDVQQTQITKVQTQLDDLTQCLKEDKTTTTKLMEEVPALREKIAQTKAVECSEIAQMHEQMENIKSANTTAALDMQSFTHRLHFLERTAQAQKVLLERNDHSIQNLNARYNGLTTEHLYRAIVALIDPHEGEFRKVAADIKDIRGAIQQNNDRLDLLESQITDIKTRVIDGEQLKQLDIRLQMLEEASAKSGTAIEVKVLSDRVYRLESENKCAFIEEKVAELEKRTSDVAESHSAGLEQAKEHSTRLSDAGERISKVEASCEDLRKELYDVQKKQSRLESNAKDSDEHHQITRTEVSQIYETAQNLRTRLEEVDTHISEVEQTAKASHIEELKRIAKIEDEQHQLQAVLKYHQLEGPADPYSDGRMLLIENLASIVTREKLADTFQKHKVPILKIDRFTDTPSVKVAVVELAKAEHSSKAISKMDNTKWHGRSIQMKVQHESFNIDEYRKQQEAKTSSSTKKNRTVICISDQEDTNDVEDNAATSDCSIQNTPNDKVEPYLRPWVKPYASTGGGKKSEFRSVTPRKMTKRKRSESHESGSHSVKRSVGYGA